jgi:ABC-type phosphate transport system auxiliary subunit
MKIQKKAIEHVLAKLNEVEQCKVYSHVSKTAEILEIDNDKKLKLLNEMSDAQQKYITASVKEAKIWLQTLLEDLNGS